MTLIPQWLVYALISLLLYGLWAFFPKLASLHLPVRDVILYQMIGINIVGLVLLISAKVKVQVNLPGILFSVLGGASGIIGTYCFIKAFGEGKTYVVVTLTALYPIITIILAFIFLREILTVKNMLGILFALIAMYLFATP